jgi:hypothetical protein
MNNFFKNKKRLYILAGAVVSLMALVIFIWLKIAAFKETRNKQQTLVNDPKITETTRNKEYSEVSRESAAGIFAGRDSLRVRSETTNPAATIPDTGGNTKDESLAVPVASGKDSPGSGRSTPRSTNGNRSTNGRSTSTSAGTAAVTDTVVKTALEQQLEQIENRTTTSSTVSVPKKQTAGAQETPKSPQINLTVVKGRTPSVYSTYKEELTTTHDNVILFSAKVYGFQKIKTNETVTLRNTEVVVSNGHTIPAGSIFRGVAKMSGNRMSIDITSAVSRDGRYSVKMSIYDNDFVKGIFVKEVSEATEDNVSSATDAAINIATSAVPFGSVVKSVGKETVKQTQRALEKQNKITITLEDGYDVYLAIATK